MIADEVHRSICQNIKAVELWFSSYRERLVLPFYTSVDVRDSHLKVAGIDANLYPAGFNNICPADLEHIPDIMSSYLHTSYQDVKKIALITEEHTNNPPYWDNVFVIRNCLQKAGFDVRVCIPRGFKDTATLIGATGRSVVVYPSQPIENRLVVGEGWEPDLIISNNDFSQSYEEWGENLDTPINPAREMGWYQRKKSNHFQFYNRLASEFAEKLSLDPWVFTVRTETFFSDDLLSEESVKRLSTQVDSLIDRVGGDYRQRQMTGNPVVFIKNNSGTYGLGVVSVTSGKDVLAWNSKIRKQMKVSKGKRTVSDLILQEGIPSAIRTEVGTAEPTIYMVGCELVGGFLRAHAEKAADESLNSPGAVYQRLCVSDLKVQLAGKPLENVYGWVARISSLAIGLEIESMGVKFKDYKISSHCPTA